MDYTSYGLMMPLAGSRSDKQKALEKFGFWHSTWRVLALPKTTKERIAEASDLYEVELEMHLPHRVSDIDMNCNSFHFSALFSI